MRGRTWLIILGALVLAALVGGSLYRTWTDSPRYALQHMALALKTRDMPTFFKYVDLKEILNNLGESAGTPSGPGEGGQEASRPSPGWLPRHPQLRILSPKLINCLETPCRKLLESYLRHLDDAKILAIAAAATTAKIEVQGDEARVTLVDSRSKEALHFQMQRQADSGTWRIVGVDYQDLKKFFKREF